MPEDGEVVGEWMGGRVGVLWAEMVEQRAEQAQGQNQQSRHPPYPILSGFECPTLTQIKVVPLDRLEHHSGKILKSSYSKETSNLLMSSTGYSLGFGCQSPKISSEASIVKINATRPCSFQWFAYFAMV